MIVEASKYSSTATAYSGSVDENLEKCNQSAICFRAAGGFTITIAAAMFKTIAAAASITSRRAACTKNPVDNSVAVCGKLETPTIIAPISEVGVIYFNRRPFVDNAVSASFTSGMLTKLVVSDPSVIAAALGFPVEVLKSLGILVKL
jgi:hypothetical protein